MDISGVRIYCHMNNRRQADVRDVLHTPATLPDIVEHFGAVSLLAVRIDRRILASSSDHNGSLYGS